ncbi:MAG: hypothetical protein NZ899_00430 [Thermoguttaceae bacterium]|nr:hypothetical protein [Thermoguttaceae bacterium]MDW8077362.1 hypothetical protein [Thermoguttaceae bacterium]
MFTWNDLASGCRATYRIGLLAVITLVLLRISIGWHFLYEGVWKLARPEFTSEPFLLEAKGPFAPIFYAMVPDVDGRIRLKLDPNGAKHGGRPAVSGDAYLEAWKAFRDRAERYYGFSADQAKQADALLAQYESALRQYLAENAEAIRGYFVSLEHFQMRLKDRSNRAYHEKERIWKQQQQLRAEVRQWLTDLDNLGRDFQAALLDILTPEQRAKGRLRGPLHTAEALPFSLPFVTTRMELINFAVSWGLTAIGLCLIAGLFTRLAALGGAAFLIFVLMVQPPWPTIYPPAPEVVGHALIVDKNFVELIGLLVLAACGAGQWAGLDYIFYQGLGKPVLVKLGWIKPGEPLAQAA